MQQTCFLSRPRHQSLSKPGSDSRSEPKSKEALRSRLASETSPAPHPVASFSNPSSSPLSRRTITVPIGVDEAHAPTTATPMPSGELADVYISLVWPQRFLPTAFVIAACVVPGGHWHLIPRNDIHCVLPTKLYCFEITASVRGRAKAGGEENAHRSHLAVKCQWR